MRADAVQGTAGIYPVKQGARVKWNSRTSYGAWEVCLAPYFGQMDAQEAENLGTIIQPEGSEGCGR